MKNNYSFLIDHSYSIRIDYDKLSKKSRRFRKTPIQRTISNNKEKQRKSSIKTKSHLSTKSNKKSKTIELTSLSIEERVKLRRTKPLPSTKKFIKSKKFFLGSGLDLDNIVLGNRQRRSVQA